MDDHRKSNNGEDRDEGWWESVLADEAKYVSHHQKPERNHAHNVENPPDQSETENIQIDWDLVRQYYKNDRIIELTVIGHNRGGLLVEGSGLSGFVPCSHLIELGGRETTDERDVDLLFHALSAFLRYKNPPRETVTHIVGFFVWGRTTA